MPWRRILPALVAALTFAGMAVLYAAGQRGLYDGILRSVGVDPYAFPFVDTDTILSAVRCLREGVDVFVTNPCDPVRRVFDYSPLWLVLAKLPVTEAWITPAGLFIDISFIASLLLLPAGRGAAQTMLIVLGVLSSAVFFGMERGNNDLVIFTLTITAAALVHRTPALRVIGYASALLAGFLKYYPMTLLAMMTRERPARFVAILAGVLVAVAIFLLTLGHDLSRALHLVPVGQLFGDMYGSTILPRGLATWNGWPDSTTVALRIALTVMAVGAGVWLGLRPAVIVALERLTEAERTMLLAGGLLILGSFFTAQNIGYRAVHLLMTLPALTALWRLRAGPMWPAATLGVLALLWAMGWRNAIAVAIGGRETVRGTWFAREIIWWLVVTMLIGVVFALIARSQMLLRRWR